MTNGDVPSRCDTPCSRIGQCRPVSGGRRRHPHAIQKNVCESCSNLSRASLKTIIYLCFFCIFLFVFVSLLLCFLLYTLSFSHDISPYFSIVLVFGFLDLITLFVFFFVFFNIIYLIFFTVKGDALLWHRNIPF